MLLQALWNLFQSLEFSTSLKLANICLFRLDSAIVKSPQSSYAFLWKVFPNLPNTGFMTHPSGSLYYPITYWSCFLIIICLPSQTINFIRGENLSYVLLYPQSQYSAQKITGIQEKLNDAIYYNTKQFGMWYVPSLFTSPLLSEKKEYHISMCDLCDYISVQRDYYFIYLEGRSGWIE